MAVVPSPEELVWMICFILGSWQAYFADSGGTANKVWVSKEGNFLRCNGWEVTAAEIIPSEDQSYSALLCDCAKSAPWHHFQRFAGEGSSWRRLCFDCWEGGMVWEVIYTEADCKMTACSSLGVFLHKADVWWPANNNKEIKRFQAHSFELCSVCIYN